VRVKAAAVLWLALLAGALTACSGDGEAPEAAATAVETAATPARRPAAASPASAIAPARLETAEAEAPPEPEGSYLLDTSDGALYYVTALLYGVWAPDGGVLAFARCCEGDGFIDLLDVATGESRRVATGDVRDLAWSPDGSKLAFVAINDLHQGIGLRVVGRDGSGVRSVATHQGAGEPRWLDDDRIAYTVGVPNAPDASFYLARVSDPGQQTPLRRGEPVGDLDPRVVFGFPSPDGAWVVLFEGPYRIDVGSSMAWERATRALTFVAPRLVLAQWAQGTHRALLTWFGAPGGAPLAEVVDFDTGARTALAGGFESRWAADAATVVYLGYQCSRGEAQGETDVFAVRPGSPAVNVSRTPGELEYEVVPAPSRNVVAYTARAADGDSWLLTVRGLEDGAAPSTLTFTHPVHVRDGAWSADGRYVLFTLGGAEDRGCR
jgi:dipeptidyl aminopeptidase/acylaminoacyl peptidase